MAQKKLLYHQAYQLLKTKQIVRPRDLKAVGIPESYLWKLANQGKIQHLGRGLYTVNNLETTVCHSLVEAAHYVPKGIVCLLSALQFHDLTTQLPPAIWLALPAHAHRPRIAHLTLELVHLKSDLMSVGVETYEIERTPLRIFSAARTLAECFKFRNRIGLDVAMEALKTGLHQGINTDEIWYFAHLFRVRKIMLPYLEALV